MQDPLLNQLGLGHLDTEEKYTEYVQKLNDGERSEAKELITIANLTLDTLKEMASVLFNIPQQEITSEQLAGWFVSNNGLYHLPAILASSPFEFTERKLGSPDYYTVIEALRVKVDGLLYSTDRWSLAKIREMDKQGLGPSADI